MESFHKTLKKEYVWPHEFAIYPEASQVLEDVFVDYNSERIHSSIGCLIPDKFVVQWGEERRKISDGSCMENHAKNVLNLWGPLHFKI